ncbi:hypothetical protein NUV30_09285 [Kocuria rhizophila]|uniref:hypothetical protein n=1 Tax=Kocuria rhizophila TaxID=72000 RepID=UPI00037C6A8F|nr:hypothetical protein [Kocuria rhizophila]MCR4526561.1 hypothetical protein [Kocuria rhizophila]MCT1917589.1 hypothetical protein [Kocuria rhizophila]
MSTTPNEPQNPQSGVPGQPGPAPSGQPMPYGQGAVNGAPQGGPNGQPSGQQYGQAGGKYGTAEYNPGQYTGTMERPSTVDRLLKLTLISLAIYVLSSILGFISLGTIDYSQVAREQGMDPSQAESAAQLAGAFGLVGGIIVTVIMIGLYLLVYFPLKAGKNWGRILGTIFAVLAILSGIYGLFSGQEGLSTGIFIAGIVLSVIKLIVDILWIVTAYKAPTSAWFNQNRVQR